MAGVPDPASGETYDDYQQHLQKALLATTRLSHSLPPPSDLAFHRSLDRSFASSLDSASERLLELINGALSLVSTAKRASKGKQRKDLDDGDEMVFQNEEEVVDGYARATELVDWLLERTDDTLDILSGRKAISDAAVASIIAASTRPAASSLQKPRRPGANLPRRILNDTTLAKPQRHWKVENRRGVSWTPHKALQKRKWHALPGNERVVTSEVDLGDRADESDEPKRGVPHPYALEIAHVRSEASPSDAIYQPGPLPEPGSVPSIDDSFASRPYTFVDTPELFATLLTHLRTCGPSGAKATELALDLEHHDLRSYYGVTCLLQLSSRSADFIIDVLSPALRPLLPSLGEFLADPAIVKVLHGAESDVIWLQRDLGLYLVNLFDTHHAASVLGFPKRSLASLLETFVSFQADKRYQLADWRIRPLPSEMELYARSDTHFLLPIYDRLRHLLLEKANSPSLQSNGSPWAMFGAGGALAPFNEVLRRSADTSLRRWVPPEYDFDEGQGPEGWRGLAIKWGKAPEWGIQVVGDKGKGRGRGGGTGVAFEVFRAAHDWRDKVAREADESPRYVLSNQLLFKLADRLPTTSSDVLSCCSPVPALISSHAAELADLISRTSEAARARGAQEVVPLAAQADVANALPKPFERRQVEVEVKPAKGVWDASSSVGKVAAAGSALFGGSMVKRSLVAPASALFGEDDPVVVASRRRPPRLLIADVSVAPDFAREFGVTAAGARVVADEPVQEREGVDHVFVPRSQRGTRPDLPADRQESSGEGEKTKDEQDEDEVIWAKGSPAKKRKRNKDKNRVVTFAPDVVAAPAVTPDTTPGHTDQETGPSSSSSNKKKQKKQKRVKVEDVKPFDYSAEPSILDRKRPPAEPSPAGKQDGSTAGEGGAGGKKKKRATEGKPPRKMNEPKGGNMTMRWTG